MKTPREILFGRHRATEAKLDEIRKEVVAAEFHPPAETARRSLFQTCWQELVLPARWIWSGIAAGWVAILFFSFAAGGETAPVVAKKSEPANPQVIMALRQQKLLLQQLIETAGPTPEATPGRPSPRGQRQETFLIG